jgi:nucleoside-diphosphate-sugar epimerase
MLVFIGLGKLTTPLLEKLKPAAFSTTGPSKLKQFPNYNGQILNLCQDYVKNESLLGTQVLYSVPPKKEDNYLENFQKYLADLDKGVHFIFISSTSVYGDQEEVNEKDEPKGNKLLIAQEGIIRKHFKHHTIIRPSGLVDEDRHPCFYLAGKEIPNPNAPVNLIHQSDVRRFICLAFTEKIFGTFNMAHPRDYSRIELYEKSCLKRDLQAPYAGADQNSGKRIRSIYMKEYFHDYLDIT